MVDETKNDRVTGSGRTDRFVGTWLIGQYRILKRLDSGGMSTVYLAEQVAMDRRAAIKILEGKAPEQALRFRKEARASSRLNHPNIVTVYNFGELDDGTLFLAMEYVAGRTMFEVIRKGPIPLEQALDIAAQCASALAYAHDRGVVHRDLKPSNIMLDQALTPAPSKVLDFGIATVSGAPEFTVAGDLLGTPRYMSPEQCRGDDATAAVDQYALGLVLFEMLTGDPVFEATSPVGYIFAHQDQAPPRLSDLPLDDERKRLLGPTLARMLAKDPSARFPHMSVVQEVLVGLRRRLDAAPEAEVATVDLSGFEADETLVDAPQNEPVPVKAVPSAAAVVDAAGRAALERSGFVLGDAGELIVAATTARAWRTIDRNDRSPRLLFVDAPPASEAIAAAKRFDRVLIGRAPVDPAALAPVLDLLRRDRMDVFEQVTSGGQRSLAVSASHLKSQYVDALLEDLEASGIRARIRRTVQAMAEELILNAIFHAPVEDSGERLYGHLDRDTPVTLDPSREATLRWAVDERFVVLSMKDSWGSLTADHLIGSIGTGAPRAPRPGDRGARIGLQIVCRSSRHVFFTIVSSVSTEITALVDRTSSRHSTETVAVIQADTASVRKVGDRLWLTEIPGTKPLIRRLRGEINETSDLTRMFEGSGPVVVDLAGVAAINSSGVVNWMKGRRTVAESLELRLDRCPPPIVNQLNMIQGFAELRWVRSIQLPFYCEECDEEFIRTLDVTAPPVEPETTEPCPGCGQHVEMDEMPEQYLAFLSM